MLDAVQTISFLGFELDSESVNMLFKLPEGKLQKKKRRMQADSERRRSICRRNVSTDRKINFNNAGCYSSKIILSLYANDPDQRFTQKQALQSNDSYIRGGKDRTRMVDKSIRGFKREINHRFKSINDSNARCFRHSTVGAHWKHKAQEAGGPQKSSHITYTQKNFWQLF